MESMATISASLLAIEHATIAHLILSHPNHTISFRVSLQAKDGLINWIEQELHRRCSWCRDEHSTRVYNCFPRARPGECFRMRGEIKGYEQG